MKGINTNLLHGYPVIDDYTGAASIPKYQVTTFDQKEGYKDCGKYSYSRFWKSHDIGVRSSCC